MLVIGNVYLLNRELFCLYKQLAFFFPTINTIWVVDLLEAKKRCLVYSDGGFGGGSFKRVGDGRKKHTYLAQGTP